MALVIFDNTTEMKLSKIRWQWV